MIPDDLSSTTILAADVGNSKTDVLLLAGDGSLLGAVRGPTTSHQRVGFARGVRRLVELAAAAGAGASGPPGAADGPDGGADGPGRADGSGGADAPGGAGAPPGTDAPLAPADLAVVCAAGADTPALIRRLRGRYERAGLARRAVVRCDTDAILRAGSPVGWGIALVCGSGVNCLGMAPDGRAYRIPALGPMSGDWGGGSAVGLAGLGAAFRGRDGRGPRTILERTLPPLLGVWRPVDVAGGIFAGRIKPAHIRDLSPAVFAAARDGDAEARAIVDRLAVELATMAGAAIRRLHLVRTPTPVVLGGAVFGADDPGFLDRLRSELAARAPLATAHRLDAPPVLGAALLGLDEIGAPEAARERLRTELSRAGFVRVEGAPTAG